LCLREKDAVYKANKILEENYEALNAAQLLLKNTSNPQGNDSSVELNIVKQELSEQDKLIDLLKQEIGSQNIEIGELNKLILNKDDVVKGCQEQLASHLEQEYSKVKMCQSKEHMIQSQYLVVDGLKNMTDLQDRLGRAKDMALKILQNTVYQMVDRIPECSNTATQGLKAEISALQNKQMPLESMVENMRRTLDATKDILTTTQTSPGNSRGHDDEIQKYTKMLYSHTEALNLCRQVTARQHQELETKFVNRNKELGLYKTGHQGDVSQDARKCNCNQFCQQKHTRKEEDGVRASSLNKRTNPIRIKPEQCTCNNQGCHAYVTLQQCGNSIDVLSCNLDACKHLINEDTCKQLQK